MQEFIINILSLFFGAAVTFIFSRKKQEAEITGIQLDNINKAVDIWRNTAEELTAKVDVLTQKCAELTAEVDLLRRENRSLKLKLDKTIQTIDKKSN